MQCASPQRNKKIVETVKAWQNFFIYIVTVDMYLYTVRTV
jgi:hypothetical protein